MALLAISMSYGINKTLLQCVTSWEGQSVNIQLHIPGWKTRISQNLNNWLHMLWHAKKERQTLGSSRGFQGGLAWLVHRGAAFIG
eukprot:3232885-Pyramimonas_sp.AAC.1